MALGPFIFRELKDQIGDPQSNTNLKSIAALLGQTTLDSQNRSVATMLGVTGTDTVSSLFGAGTDAVTGAGVAGSIHSKLRNIIAELANATYGLSALNTDLDAVLVDTGDGTDATVGPGLAGSLHAHIREVQVDTDALLVDTGDGTDASTAAGVAGSLHSKLRKILDEVGHATYGLSALNTDLDAILVDTGDGTDAAVGPGLAGSLHAHIREVQVDTDAILVDTGDGTDAAVAAGTAGSLHAHIRDAQVGIDNLEVDLGDFSAYTTLQSLKAVIGSGFDTNNKNLWDKLTDIQNELTQEKIESATITLYPWQETGTGVLNADPTELFNTSGTTSSTTYVEVVGYTVDSGETGTKTVVTCRLDVGWRGQITTGTGGGNSKWAVTAGSSYVGASALDVTDELAETTTLATRYRSGSIKRAQQNTLPFRLSLLGKVAVGTDVLTLKPSSETQIDVTYQT